MARNVERIPIQEVVELTGISMPTIYRRIRRGEIRAALCIDSRGKHWEIDKSELAKLTLKRNYARSRDSVWKTAEMAAVGSENFRLPEHNAEVSENTSDAAEHEAVPASPAEPKRSVGRLFSYDSAAGEEIRRLTAEAAAYQEQIRSLKKLCQDLESEKEMLQEELDNQRDESAYWRGRWEEASLNFNSIRQALADKNEEDQEQIWSMRDQIYDLQEQVSLGEEALNAERELRLSSSGAYAAVADTEDEEPAEAEPAEEAEAAEELSAEEAAEYEERAETEAESDEGCDSEFDSEIQEELFESEPSAEYAAAESLDEEEYPAPAVHADRDFKTSDSMPAVKENEESDVSIRENSFVTSEMPAVGWVSGEYGAVNGTVKRAIPPLPFD